MSSTDAPTPAERAPRRRSTRDRPAKPPLSEEAIVAAALAILKREGLEAVTMRRVAQALDTGAASLYVYVSGRNGLLAAMMDHVTATIELEPPDPARWREQVHSLLRRMREALLAHPGTAALTLADPPTSEVGLTLAENLLGILFAGGFSPQDAAWACDLLVLLVQGVASEDDARLRAGAAHGDFADAVQEIYNTFVALPPERFPLLSRYATEMVTGDREDRFRFAVDVVLDGVLARALRRR